MRCVAFLSGLLAQRRGAVSLLAALMLPCLLGTAGLVVEYGRGVLAKIENQRVADSAAYAGAVAYNAATSNAGTAMTNAAQGVATLNGVDASKVTALLVDSPTNTPNTKAVKVTVTTSVPLVFSRLLGSASTLAVPAEAYAEMRPNAGPCILALSAAASGVALTGGTKILATLCVVASNSAVTVPCGTGITSIGVSYNTILSQLGCIGIFGADGLASSAALIKKSITDPLAGSADIATARARLTSVASLTVPNNPSGPPAPAAPVVAVPGGTYLDIDLAYNPSATQAQAVALGCTASQSGSTWTLTCPAGTHNINNFTVGGGLSVAFAGSASTVYNFAQPMSTGPAISFGNGSFTFKQGLTIGYGGATFGSGTLNVIGALNTGGSGGTATFGSTNVNVTGNASFNSTTALTGTGTFAVGGALTTNGTTSIAQSNVNVVGAMSFGGTTTLSGTGTLAVGGALTTGGTPAIAQSTITVTGAFSVTNSITMNALTTLKVGGLMNVGTSGTMNFGVGATGLAYTLAGGLQTGGSSVITFGAGTFNVGRMATANNGAQYSIYSGATSVTFGGASTFLLNSGIDVGGGSTVILGNAGTDNSFRIGPSYVALGLVYSNAILIAGGSTFRMGDATGASSLFEVAGPINVASGGGSCTAIAAAAQHDIYGNLTTAGGTILGPGVYTVYGSVGIGANGGGDVVCNGATTGLLANDVSMIVGGNGVPLTGSCLGQSFCVAAGYSNVVLSARTLGATAKMAIVGPASLATGALFTEGSSGTTLSGLVYYPTGTVRLDGASSVGNGTLQCLQMVGKEILLNGGAVLASTCISGSGAGTGGSVVLVR